ncbi:O-antigen ligase family protein [Parvularcula marina]|uniref:O-antigen ligase family protein n=1 Tax=Parvularcula marina TaxID=2292771 RepID=A0A371RI13_9PROT|nr:O-antigen ligase [Parvularcula marina]RFB05075.1 O-antigen ligase family protein [Parvularcula marina]
MSQSAPFSAFAAPNSPVSARISLQPGRGNLLDELMAMGAFVIMPLGFPMAQPLRLPFTILLILWLGMNWRSILPVVRKGWPLFVLPVLCLISALWADNMMVAIRYGALFSLAMLFAAGVASRLDARQVAVAIVCGQGMLAVASALTGTREWIGGADGGFALIGVFPHKNILAQHMVILSIAALSVTLSSQCRPVLRLLSACILAVALGLIAQALSATAILLLAGAIPLGLGLVLIWRPAVHIRGLRPALVLGGIAVMTFGLLVLTNFYGVNLIEDTLGAFGKDQSLTGRTVIWAAGNDAISKHPLLGVGAGNFWLADNFTAVRLADQFYSSDGQFRFHNAYYETTVHLGLIGLLAAIYTYVRGGLLTFGAWWRNQERADIFFLLIVVVLLIRSFTESELFYALALGPMLFWTAAFTSLMEKPSPTRPAIS